eukprot:TRINITY_DN5436_c0_g2_i2.p1 TRINITY_DN5436_c0_g2~~TRINITY_DN5436_c0_g2_i2.p1  ORF type:complete len:819 (+),score=169.54 TRINITY_DN5436_c0_g2_i2:185-2458(+)
MTTITATTTSTVTTQTATIAASSAERQQAATAAVEKIKEEEQNAAKNLLKTIDMTTKTEPVTKVQTTSTGQKLTIAVMTPAMAAAKGGKIELPSGDSGVKVTIPLAVLKQVSGGGNGPVALSSSALPESQAKLLEAAGGDAASSGAPKPKIAAPPVSISLFDSNGKPIKVQLEEPMLLTMQSKDSANLSCGYFDEDTKAWSNRGVRKMPRQGGDNQTNLVCETTHLTIFAALLNAFLSTLKCSNAQGLFSAKGAEMLLKDDSWFKRAPAVLLWTVVTLLLISYSLALAADRRFQLLVDVRDVQINLVCEMFEERQREKEEKKKKKEEKKKEKEEKKKEQEHAQSEDESKETKKASLKRQNAEELEDVAFSEYMIGELKAFVESKVSLLRNLPTKVLNFLAVKMEAAKSGFQEDTHRLMQDVEKKHPGENRMVKAATRDLSTMLEVTQEIETGKGNGEGEEEGNDSEGPTIVDRFGDVMEMSYAGAQAFMFAPWYVRGLLLLPAMHPWLRCAGMVSIFWSRTARVGVLATKIMGSAAVAAIFYQSSGGALDRSSDPDCSPPSNALEAIVQAATIGICSAIFSDGMVIVLALVRSPTLGLRAVKSVEQISSKYLLLWSVQTKLFWMIFLSYQALCTYILCVFFANTTNEDSFKLMKSWITSIIQGALVGPLGTCIVFATIAATILCIRPELQEDALGHAEVETPIEPEPIKELPNLRSAAQVWMESPHNYIDYGVPLPNQPEPASLGLSHDAVTALNDT